MKYKQNNTASNIANNLIELLCVNFKKEKYVT